jgi:hypothetical protein
MRVCRFDREEFLTEFWDYRPGQHVAILAPTDYGKTYLCHQLLQHTVSPELPAVELVRKKRDSTVSRWAEESGFQVVRGWPPPPDPRYMKPPGVIVWPRHRGHPALDDPAHRHVFGNAIRDTYNRGGNRRRGIRGRILVCDEAAALVRLGLEPECDMVLTMGRDQPCGAWMCSQRPRNIPLTTYSMSQHLFLGYNKDDQDRKRYGEIGGVDKKLVWETVENLNWHEWLYIKTRGEDGPELAIIGK